MYTFRLVRLYVLTTLQNYLTRAIREEIPALAEIFTPEFEREVDHIRNERLMDWARENGMSFDQDFLLSKFRKEVIDTHGIDVMDEAIALECLQ